MSICHGGRGTRWKAENWIGVRPIPYSSEQGPKIKSRAPAWSFSWGAPTTCPCCQTLHTSKSPIHFEIFMMIVWQMMSRKWGWFLDLVFFFFFTVCYSEGWVALVLTLPPPCNTAYCRLILSLLPARCVIYKCFRKVKQSRHIHIPVFQILIIS